MRDQRLPETAGVRDRIAKCLERSALAARPARVVPLTGDASDRSYFRVLTPGAPSFVLALHGGPIDYETLPFVNVADLLRRIPVPVPAILEHHDHLGALALEDLGDVTLQAHLGTTTPDEHADLYREAVRLIVLLQARGAELASPAYVPYGIAFDTAKLTWELDFFVRHFVQAYRGAVVTPAGADALAAEWAALAGELAAEPRVLCHRDYHSRNLMWHEGRLYVIDFQDARLGPDTYDLASLLRDSYVDLPDDLFDELVEEFLHLRGGEPDTAGFRRRFDRMALQRNLKALGTFGYQTTARGNPVYLQYIPRTLRYVRDTLAKYPRFATLRRTLASLVEELA
jgi:aminoglycoside/choline kinase family phosphotransferase